ncbi:hypothetical protein [Streptomyces sp. Ag109_O5-10]|uniref:hypothetical protein n=1 Tax=Streptomyces sp. Ag109_O5-10 TaxID=1855349 RepID=UPI000898041E|nr:hypothetical protein [Streptomyces sp. Ag109_O5-10]SEF16835.1 hypothetical protein SAMN05216533_8011 [Streptomyces sp. Ag109_O5-10]
MEVFAPLFLLLGQKGPEGSPLARFQYAPALQRRLHPGGGDGHLEDLPVGGVGPPPDQPTLHHVAQRRAQRRGGDAAAASPPRSADRRSPERSGLTGRQAVLKPVITVLTIGLVMRRPCHTFWPCFV